MGAKVLGDFLMLVSTVYVLTWKKLLGSFESSLGTVIPQKVRSDLLKYFTEGEIPKGFLYGLLTRDFDQVFYSEKTPLEAQRLQAIWEFIQTCVPTKLWGSEKQVKNYALLVSSGGLGAMQMNFFEKQKEIENNIFEEDELVTID
jgi:hypothetical protein